MSLLRRPTRSRPRSRWRTLAGLALAGGLLAGTLPAGPASAAGCTPGLTYTWTGDAHTSDWSTAGNWDQGCVPGLRLDPQTGDPRPADDRVVIRAGASVVLDDAEAQLARLTNSGTLTISPSGVLSNRLSSTSTALLLQGLLFGTGDFTVTSSMVWDSTAPGSASTMSTRRCGQGWSDCLNTVPPAQGRTVVAAGAVVTVPGLGVNLRDQRVLENHGRVVLTGHGFLAADRGTAFRNLHLAGQPEPTYEIRNDGWYDQGFLPPGQPLSTFVNTGLVLKATTSGSSIMDAAYSSTDPATTEKGRVEIRKGTLLITTSPTATQDAPARKAYVKQGATFGDGSKDGTTPGAPQAASVALPAVGTALVPVTVQQLRPVSGSLGVHVRIETPGASATTSAPMLFRLYVDASLHPGRTAAQVAQTAPVQRQADTSSPFVTLPDCRSGLPTATQACVARGLSSTETSALQTANPGDAVLVVKSLQNSRYKV